MELGLSDLAVAVNNGPSHEARRQRCAEAHVEDFDEFAVFDGRVRGDAPERILGETQEIPEGDGAARDLHGGICVGFVEDGATVAEVADRLMSCTT